MASTALAGVSIGLMGTGLALTALEPFVTSSRLARALDPNAMLLGAVVLLLGSLVVGMVSARGPGYAAGGIAGGVLLLAAFNYVRFRRSIGSINSTGSVGQHPEVGDA